MKQKELSVWLRVIVILLGLAVLFFAVIVAPEQGDEIIRQNPGPERMLLPCLLFVWVSALPVFAALVLAWLIFAAIGRDNSFCMANALRLRAISILAFADTAFYILGAFVLGLMKLLHPSILIMVICIVFMGLAIAVGTAALSHLTKKAADMKAENDLVI